MYLEKFFIKYQQINSQLKIFSYQSNSYNFKNESEVLIRIIQDYCDRILETEQKIVRANVYLKTRGKKIRIYNAKRKEDIISYVSTYTNFLEKNKDKFDKVNEPDLQELIDNCNKFLYVLNGWK